MIRRPSNRRKSRSQKEIDLPLVPLMDTFVTLIAFLLMATALLAVTLIKTPVPIVSNDPPEKKPLALTLRIDQDEVQIESGFNRIRRIRIPRVEETYDTIRIHDELVKIKQQFPHEKSITLMPDSKVKYDDIIAIMDASRLLSEADPPMYHKVKDEETGLEEERVTIDLFPNVVFGNILGG